MITYINFIQEEKMKEFFISLALLLIGIFSIGGSYFNWEFFFNNRKAKRLVNIIGRKGARVFYFVLGLIFVTAGAVSLVTGINIS